MNSSESQCLFCRVNPEHLAAENELCYAAKDSFPATEFHTLIIPKRHVANYFDLRSSEVSAMHEMLVKMNFVMREKTDFLSRNSILLLFQNGISQIILTFTSLKSTRFIKCWKR